VIDLGLRVIFRRRKRTGGDGHKYTYRGPTKDKEREVKISSKLERKRKEDLPVGRNYFPSLDKRHGGFTQLGLCGFSCINRRSVGTREVHG